jgi:toxin ParE1/3/4
MRIELATRVARDFERIYDHLEEAGVADPLERIDEIRDALKVLLANPRIGRPEASGRRELVIGEGARGYIALYRYFPDKQVVQISAIRAQRESGFRD